MNSKKLDFNQNYWAFIRIILSDPDKFLKLDAKILLNIVEGNNHIKVNQRYISKKLNISQSKISVKCKVLEKEKIISRTKYKLSKILTFNQTLLDKGKEIPFEAVQEYKNG